MCRRGKQEENKHCYTCGYCMHISTYDDHVCKEKKVESDCPICLEVLNKVLCTDGLRSSHTQALSEEVHQDP
jgi:hypothetical protein